MRDLVAALIAVALLLFALLVGATLHFHRQRRERTRRAAREGERTIIAELPQGSDLVYVTEDHDHLYVGDQSIEKASIRGVRLLVNGRVVSQAGETRTDPAAAPRATADEEAFIRDRWDVLVDTDSRTVTIACGAIRERISQDLARRIYDSVASHL
ncbi:MAG TPA: hypothetical protein VHI98_22805 [Vicinamibacterales bacterium]|nr:hypothetical protein [Vicinamibacterales bacterium]